MQFGRGLAGIGGVAVIAVAAFLYFGLDRTEQEEAPSEIVAKRQSEAGDLSSPTGEETRASRVAAARAKRKADRERRRQRARSATGETTRPEEGSSRAAAERLRREGGTGASGAREPRSEAADRAQIEALFREAARMPREKAVTPSDESTSEKPDERDPGERDLESETPCASVGSPIVMSCASDPWICSAFNMAFSLQDTIPVISDGKEAIHLPLDGRRGEVWERTPDGVIRHPTVGVTNASDMICVLQ